MIHDSQRRVGGGYKEDDTRLKNPTRAPGSVILFACGGGYMRNDQPINQLKPLLDPNGRSRSFAAIIDAEHVYSNGTDIRRERGNGHGAQINNEEWNNKYGCAQHGGSNGYDHCSRAQVYSSGR